MCGIIGFIGYESCYLYILNGLLQLQNRGYDSAGLCTLKIIEENQFQILISKLASTSKKMAINELKKEDIKNIHLENTIGIGHTRWATHGSINDVNAHPHLSFNGFFSIVHNGIIENFEKLKDFLINKNYKFQSETDSEVIANLLEDEYINSQLFLKIDNESTKLLLVLKSIENVIEKLEGTYGLVILCKETPNSIYCVRKGSPLLFSVNDKFCIIASEKNGFDGKVKDYHILKSKDICVFTKENGKITFKTKHNYKSNLIKEDLKKELTHETWTLQEIMEEKYTILRATGNGGRLKNDKEVKLGGLETYKEELKKIDNIILLGCGSSYYASAIGSSYFRDLCDLNTVQFFDGADFNTKNICKYGKTAIIFSSQSGETCDLYRCIEIGRKNNCLLIGVVNVVDSLIAREVDCGCYLNAGREVAVGSTKSFTSQVVVLSLIAVYVSQIKNPELTNKRIKYITDLRSLQQDFIETLENCENLCKEYINLLQSDGGSCFVIGKKNSEAIAKEGALKLKEWAYIHAEGYSSSSLKHGPFALLNENFPVILLAPKNGKCYEKIKNAYFEIKLRKANIICITNDKSFECENKILISSNKTFQELLCVLPLQLIAYHLSRKKDINPDFPKNLAKVVTVE